MEEFTNKELAFINSINEPITNIDNDLVNTIINKMIINKEYEELICFLNSLNDFAQVPSRLVNRLIDDNNKECISVFLENIDDLYFFDDLEKQKLKNYLNVKDIFIKLPETYNYYYRLLFSHGVRLWKSINNNEYIEHIYTRYNELIKIRLIESSKFGVIASYINYLDYNLSREEQILNCINYINQFGLNLENNINEITLVDEI